MFIRDLIAALVDAEVPYCLVGGVAVNLHGVPRMTYDIDIAVTLEAKALDACEKALASLKLIPRLPLRLAQFADPAFREAMLDERNLRAVTFTDPDNPLREVDVLVSPSGPSADDLVARSIERKTDQITVKLVDLADLVAMKTASGRPQDLADIAHLERARER